MMRRFRQTGLIGFALIALISPVKAERQSGCFDNRRFCIELKPAEQGFDVLARRVFPYPVVVTLYSALFDKHHVSAFLSSDQAIRLGTIATDAGFWDAMTVRWTTGNPNARHNNTVRYSAPLTPVQDYPVVQGFNGDYSHQGASQFAVDFAAPVGTPVLAARGGVVIDSRSDSNRGGPDKSFSSDANYVTVLHEDGTTGEYYHLKYNGVVVKRGQSVTAGQLLGYSGNTGFSSLPHLHFGVYVARRHGQFQSVPFSFASPVEGMQ